MVYIISLHWINDFIKLPILVPPASNSILADQIFSPDLSFLPVNHNDTFLSGFLNCFFLYFPLAPVQLIWLRRVIVDGPWAGVAATIGIIVGNLSFLGLCLFGFRDFINIWFGSLWEPLTYFLGIWLIFFVIFHMTQKPFKIIRKYQKKELLTICIINFALVWTDQPGLYQFFGNLVFQPGVSPLDVSESTVYFIGAILGSLLWAPLIGFGFVQFGYFVPRITKFTYSAWIKSFNLFCLIGCISLALTSLPYYGFDYLFANPLGFVPQDKVWDEINGILPLLKTNTIDANQGRLGEKSSYSSVDTDLSLFDRASYAGGPFVELNIESLNYKKEYAWRSRFDRLSSRYLTRGVGLLAKYLQIDTDPIVSKNQSSEYQDLSPLREDQRSTDSDSEEEEEIEALSAEILNENHALSEAEITEPRSEADETKLEPESKPEVKPEDLRTEAKAEVSIPGEEVFDVEDADLEEDLSEDEDADFEEDLNEAEEIDLYLESLEGLIERFIENYTAEATSEDLLIPNLPDEKMIDFSAFSEISKYGFDLFSMFEAVEVDPLDQQLAIDIKEKYSANWVYRFLVHADISNFLRRQPYKYKLTSGDEIALFENRMALNEYYNTLRSYSNLDLTKVRQSLFCGPKSYVNRIYNQQFKGTLKIVERLFSIHLEEEENIPKLPEPEWEDADATVRAAEEYSASLRADNNRDAAILKFDQPLYKTIKKNPLVHEQNLTEVEAEPFLQETSPSPFFAGWNNEQRKLIITNRLLTRQTSPLLKNEKQFSFTTWPVKEKVLQSSTIFSRLFRTQKDAIPGTEDLFKYAEPLMEEEEVIYEKLPNIIQRVELKNTEKLSTSLAPTRGGIIWPGNQPLKFQIAKKIANRLPKVNPPKNKNKQKQPKP
uniref:Ycf1 n=1 Tax=Halimeda discoidea TaxID=118222 RepID=A0A1C9JB16_9CHLO|nr:hypothetical protein [Halimeda discoidea]